MSMTAAEEMAKFRAKLPNWLHLPYPVPCPGGWFAYVHDSSGTAVSSAHGHRTATAALRAAVKGIPARLTHGDTK